MFEGAAQSGDEGGLFIAALGIMVTPFALGLLNFVQKAIVENPDQTENVIEWLVSLLMQLWFVVLWLAWRRTHLAVDVKARLS